VRGGRARSRAGPCRRTLGGYTAGTGVHDVPGAGIPIRRRPIPGREPSVFCCYSLRRRGPFTVLCWVWSPSWGLFRGNRVQGAETRAQARRGPAKVRAGKSLTGKSRSGWAPDAPVGAVRRPVLPPIRELNETSVRRGGLDGAGQTPHRGPRVDLRAICASNSLAVQRLRSYSSGMIGSGHGTGGVGGGF